MGILDQGRTTWGERAHEISPTRADAEAEGVADVSWPIGQKDLRLFSVTFRSLPFSSSAIFRVMERAFCTVVFQQRRKVSKLVRRPRGSRRLGEKAQKFFQSDLSRLWRYPKARDGVGNEKYSGTSIGSKVASL